MAKPSNFPVWDTDGDNITAPGTAQQAGGWQKVTVNGDIKVEKPPYQWMNYLMQLYYLWIAEFNKQGIVEWDATTEYDTGDLAKGSDGYLYQSRIDDNTANDPVSSSAAWKLGLINPTFVIGSNGPIDSGLQLQAVDTSPSVELATSQGATRQRLTLNQTSTVGSIDCYNENTSSALPLNLNPTGGKVAINGYEVLSTIYSSGEINKALVVDVPETKIIPVDIGPLTAGDLFHVTMQSKGTKGATSGYFKTTVRKESGTAVIYSFPTNTDILLENFSYNIGGQAFANTFTGLFIVGTGGTCNLEYVLESEGSGSTGVDTVMHVVIFKKSL